MELHRYSKNHRLKPEQVEASEFIIFWAEHKFVCGLDADGVEWLLVDGHTLKEILANTLGFVRIHRRMIVKVDAIDHLVARTPPGGSRETYCMVGERELQISRQCRSGVKAQYRLSVSTRRATTEKPA
ncbi:LytTR family transcriptional regulator [Pseudomonas edaphica]|uniref:LytTR family transcriptional regulator n=1 Tax=Pseudomonas edaphica TaxID=2006980 RepID=A0ABY2U2F8_9PSED|nr:LytTR family transcriptional regulator DNA-binding domain-containing protein [Pseudomonas edaphica]TLG90259.1 LytTR family transcriptional regulator [Pseudomonas edaphica]